MLVPTEKIDDLNIGNVENYHLSRKALEDLKIKQFHEVIEATPINTAAAIAFAAFKSQPEDIKVAL